MKIDHGYIKGLLEAFEKAEKPFTNINELEKNGYSNECDQFILHMDILLDMGLIETKSRDGGIGYRYSSCGIQITWAVIPLRLTADGHEYIALLNEPNVWENIKDDFKDSAIGTIKDVALELVTGYIKEKVSNYR